MPRRLVETISAVGSGRTHNCDRKRQPKVTVTPKDTHNGVGESESSCGIPCFSILVKVFGEKFAAELQSATLFPPVLLRARATSCSASVKARIISQWKRQRGGNPRPGVHHRRGVPRYVERS